jgi:hypothetical protein
MRGPLYCETGHPWLGIAEPVNFATNAFILVAALFATRRVLRSPHKTDLGLWLLVALLYSTGIGSALWHGLRTAFTLALDTYSGLLFLIALVGLWIGTLYGRRAGVLGLAGFVAIGFGSLALSFRLMGTAEPALRPLMLAPFFLTVIAAGGALILATRAKAGADAARLGLLTLGCGLIAATGRSADLPLCPYTPFGTHFIWHTFLSLAAYLSIALLLRIKPPQPIGAAGINPRRELPR